MASPSAPPPSAPTRSRESRPPRAPRKPIWPRSASISTLRLGVLIGGLVIIADLGAQAIMQRTASSDDIVAIYMTDQVVDTVLFILLGFLIVRETGLIYAGAVAGLFAGLLDAIVTTAAALLAPQPLPNPDPQTTQLSSQMLILIGFASNVGLGVVFAGASGVIYALVQRLPGGRRRR